MITINGTYTLNDAWLIDKFVGTAPLKRWDTANEPFALEPPPCVRLQEEAKKIDQKRVITAIDGTEYVVECGSLADISNPLPPSVSVNVNKNAVKVGEFIYITVDIVGNALVSAVDNYGRTYYITRSRVVDVRALDRYDTYVFAYRICPAGTTGRIEVSVSGAGEVEEQRQKKTKTVFVNRCSTADAQYIYSLLGTAATVADAEVSYTGIITKVDLKYIVQDMDDVATKNNQGVDIYTGTFEVSIA